jgi:3-hydroxyisobutyrate dehydrogenase-like beta-hydroxyacid dehydrogenase
MNIGILHPGEMGSSIGAALMTVGHAVFWVRRERGPATAERAAQDGLQPVATLDDLVDKVDVILSVCPPHGALDLARSVCQAGFTGIYVDANAVAPDTARQIGATVGQRAEFVDGSVIGPPARQAGSTRLYLSGDRAEAIAALFEGSLLQACTLAGGPGAASALKMCYAAWTKGSAALLMAIAALARREGVADALANEWQMSQPELPGQLQGAVQGTAAKAWRFSGEMQEIATTFRQAAMPDGFYLAAAEIYQRLVGLKDLESVESETLFKLLIAGYPHPQPPQRESDR